MALFGFHRKTEKPLRQQLLEAKAKVERQISIISAGSMDGMAWQPDTIDELQRVLAGIDQQLAELGPEDA